MTTSQPIDYAGIHQELQDARAVSVILSHDSARADTNALLVLGFRVTDREVSTVLDQEIYLSIEDIRERVTNVRDLFQSAYHHVDSDACGVKIEMDSKELVKLKILWRQITDLLSKRNRELYNVR